MLEINARRMQKFAHSDEHFNSVLHVAHSEWHGIRQCTAYLPGQKMLIPADRELTSHDENGQDLLHPIAKEIERREISHVIFHGYSENADRLLLYIKARLGTGIRCYAVNHVTTAQFDNAFEMSMISLLLTRKKFGQLEKIASVKQNFAETFEDFWPETILNYAPKIPANAFDKSNKYNDIFSPLDNGWRKNSFSNYIAAHKVKNADRLLVANYPSGLDRIMDLQRLVLVGYLRGNELFSQMSNSKMLLMATFAECQPMTQLEAFAVGTPALTGPLRLKGFEHDTLTKLCTTTNLDDPYLLAKDAQRLFDACLIDAEGTREMIADHLVYRHNLAGERYKEFLEI